MFDRLAWKRWWNQDGLPWTRLLMRLPRKLSLLSTQGLQRLLRSKRKARTKLEVSIVKQFIIQVFCLVWPYQQDLTSWVVNLCCIWRIIFYIAEAISDKVGEALGKHVSPYLRKLFEAFDKPVRHRISTILQWQMIMYIVFPYYNDKR